MRKLIEFVRRHIMRHRQRKGKLMRTITLSAEDAEQVKAILLTHAELSDNQALPSLELIGRLKNDLEQDDEALEMIASLTEQVEAFEVDSENLKRIASIF